MKDKRPINLDLISLKYPPMAITSILHRISGVVLFLLMPLLIYFLKLSLVSETSFYNLQIMLMHPMYKLLLWVFISALMYHLFAGIRHLLMDLGYGEGLRAGRISSIIVIVLGIMSMILTGIWL